MAEPALTSEFGKVLPAKRPQALIDRLDVSVYQIPTDGPESDGTLEWHSTTLVLVNLSAEGVSGVGYTYGSASIAGLIEGTLREALLRADAMAVQANWATMVKAIRNLGRPGLCSMAIAAVDAAAWDLKARLLGLPLVTLLGAARPGIPVYGSGGFTSYSLQRLQAQLAGWVEQGIPRVKMKIGRDPGADPVRVRAAREAIGSDTRLFVDANGAYDRKQALGQSETFAQAGVTWFEEPVSSDDLAGLRLLRDRAPAGIEIAAGEYGYDLAYFRRMLEAGAVDVLQADATRCAGITGWLRVSALCDAFHVPLSAHTAPSLHLHPCCAASAMRNLEYFHDHVRIERMLFEGAIDPREGILHPDLSRPGMGLELKAADAARFLVT
jgi:L-alanine-DL-glutamate epimerase-like enolase superfamily enzyme